MYIYFIEAYCFISKFFFNSILSLRMLRIFLFRIDLPRNFKKTFSKYEKKDWLHFVFDWWKAKKKKKKILYRLISKVEDGVEWYDLQQPFNKLWIESCAIYQEGYFSVFLWIFNYNNHDLSGSFRIIDLLRVRKIPPERDESTLVHL